MFSVFVDHFPTAATRFTPIPTARGRASESECPDPSACLDTAPPSNAIGFVAEIDNEISV